MSEQATWQNRIVGSGEVDPESLLANPKNWRIHSGEQQTLMRKALDRTGWLRPVIVNRTTGFVLDGHMRVALALREGKPSIPVDWVDLSEDEELGILMTFDPLAAMAATDKGKLRALESEARQEGADLAGLIDPILGRISGQSKTSEGFDKDATRESSMEKYENGTARQIHLILSQDQYAQVITRFSALAIREGLETNRDVLLWLVAQYEADREAMA